MLGLGNTLSRQSTPLSSAPVGFDKTWSFDSDTESWAASGAVLDFLSSFTPSSATAKTGILRVQDTTTGAVNTVAYVDLSAFTGQGYDNTQTLYYSIVYSVVSGTSFTSIESVIYGTSGSSVSHFSTATPDQWNTASGALTTVGSNDFFQIKFQMNPVSSTGEYAYIDSVRVSHTDFR